MVTKKSLSLFLALIMMFAFVVPAFALYYDNGEDLITFHSGSTADDSMSYRSLLYGSYGEALGEGTVAPAVTPDGTLAEGWNGQLYDGGDGSAAALKAALEAGTAQWIWSTPKVEPSATLIGGGDANPQQDGDIVLFEKEILIDGDPGDAVLNIAADNAFIVFVNDTLVYFSDTLFQNEDRATVQGNLEAALAGGYAGLAALCEGLTEDIVASDGWQQSKAVSVPVASGLLTKGDNTLTIVAFNESMKPGDAPNDEYGTEYNNPAGLVFTFVAPYTLEIITADDFTVQKQDVAGRVLADEVFHFVAYTQLDNKGNPIASSKVAEADTVDGIALFENMEAGTYYIFEELSDVRNQVGRFRPYNMLTPGRYFPFIVVDFDPANPQTYSYTFVNDYMRTLVEINKEVSFQPAYTGLTFLANTPISNWECKYVISRGALEGDVDFELDVVMADGNGNSLLVGALALYKKDDGALYGLFTPNANCPELEDGACVSLETTATVTSWEMIPGEEFGIADEDEIATLFGGGALSADIFLYADALSLDKITIQTSEVFYVKVTGPAFDNPEDGGSRIFKIVPGTTLQLGLFWGDYTIEECDADGNELEGYTPYIRASVQTLNLETGKYEAPVITDDGTFTIFKLCDKVLIDVTNTPSYRGRTAMVSYVAKYDEDEDALITDESFEFWLYLKSQYDEATGAFTGDPLSKVKTEDGFAFFLENNGTPEDTSDDFEFDPSEEYVVLEVLSAAQAAAGWTYGAQGKVMQISIYEALPMMREDNKFYNKKEEVDPPTLGSVSGTKYQRITKSGCSSTLYEYVALKGYSIYLLDSAGNVLEMKTTDDEGKFCFADLPLGSYTVVEPVNDYWKAVTGFPTTIDVTLTEAEPDAAGLVFQNYLVGAESGKFSGYGNNATNKPGMGWHTYVTLPANTETADFSLQLGNPNGGKKVNTIGTFTATVDGENLVIKLNLDEGNYSYALKNGLPEIYVGVSNGTAFYIRDYSDGTRLNATKYRDPGDDTRFVIPMSELRLDPTDPINIYVNGAVVLAPKGYQDFPIL